MRDRYSGAELNRANSLGEHGVISPAGACAGRLAHRAVQLACRLLVSCSVWHPDHACAAGLVWRDPTGGGQAAAAAGRRSYRHVLGNPRFQGNLLCLMATFAGLAVFEAAAGVLLGTC